MIRDLRSEVVAYLDDRPGSTLDEIARGIRARTADVRKILSVGFERREYLLGAAGYRNLSVAADGQGRPSTQLSQCDRILRVLSDGRPHSMQEIHRLVGFCRLNSRVAELRKRGHRITCDKTGGRYVYRLEQEVAA